MPEALFHYAGTTHHNIYCITITIRLDLWHNIGLCVTISYLNNMILENIWWSPQSLFQVKKYHFSKNIKFIILTNFPVNHLTVGRRKPTTYSPKHTLYLTLNPRTYTIKHSNTKVWEILTLSHTNMHIYEAGLSILRSIRVQLASTNESTVGSDRKYI